MDDVLRGGIGVYAKPSGTAHGAAAVRSGMNPGDKGRRVFFPDPPGGCPLSEITIAELLKTRGYATAASASGTSATCRSRCP